MKNIIDGRVRLRTKQLLKAWTTHLNPAFEQYIDLYRMKPKLASVSVDDTLKEAREAGIERIVVCGGNRLDNNHILELGKCYKEIIPVGGISLSNSVQVSFVEVQRIKDNGFAAVNISPFMAKMDVDDRRIYPLYAMCESLRLPIIVHSSIHYWRETSMWHGRPEFFDRIATDFPDLTIVMSHGGNGFGPTVLAVAQRHPNIYLEFSALNPKHMAPEFVQAANTYLRRRCIFGTDYPLLEFGPTVENWFEAIRPEVHSMFFRQNLLDALGI